MGIEGIISQQLFWIVWSFSDAFNGRILKTKLQTLLPNFLPAQITDILE
jgi:hypothetical protein